MTLQCEVSNPGAKVTWYREGIKVTPDEVHELISEGPVHKLVIRAVALGDESEYSLQVGQEVSAVTLRVKGRSRSLLYVIGGPK